MSDDGILVHFFIITRGTTLCGKRLIDFGRREWWTAEKDTAAKRVNCPDCLAARDAAKAIVEASKA